MAVIVEDASCRLQGLWTVVLWNIAASVVAHDEHIVACWTHFGSIADIVCQRIGNADVYITTFTAIDVFSCELQLSILCQVSVHNESVCCGRTEVKTLLLEFLHHVSVRIGRVLDEHHCLHVAMATKSAV